MSTTPPVIPATVAMSTTPPVIPATVDMSLTGLPDHEKNPFINKKLSDDIIPSVYAEIIDWGSDKRDDETFLECYQRRQAKLREDIKEECEKEVKANPGVYNEKWPEEKKEKHDKERLAKMIRDKEKQLITLKDKEKSKLNQKTLYGLDATFLLEVARTICDGIGFYNPNSPSDTNIEQYMKEMKDARNDICHEPKDAAVSGDVVVKLEESAVNAFKAAGKLYSLDQQIVQDKIDELKNRIENIKKELMTAEQQSLLQRARKLSEDGKDEMHATLQHRDTDYLPLSDDKISRKEVFHFVGLVVKDKQSKKVQEMFSHDLLEHFKGSHVLIEGEPGTGKSTITKMIMEDLGAKSDEKFRDVRKFDLVMFMACRNNSITTVQQILKDYMPRTLQEFTEEETEAALYHRKLLILVDGLDELTSHTRPLLDELISKFGRTGNVFIFTSRPGHAHRLQVKYETVTLQPIKDEAEQEQFLQRYQEVINKTKTPALIAAFRSLDETCKATLLSPATLAMFSALFQKTPDVVKGWKNDLGIMRAFVSLANETLRNRLTHMKLNNPEFFAVAMNRAVCDLSLSLLQNEEMTITTEMYRAMCNHVFGKDNSLNYYAIVSSFFARSSDGQSLEVFHKSVIEYLAAEAIFHELSRHKVGVVATIKTVVKKRTDWIPNDKTAAAAAARPVSNINQSAASRLQRWITGKNAVVTEVVSLKQFENVLRFVCLLLHEGGAPMKSALQRFLDEVCPALVEEDVDFSFWINLVMGCLDSDQVVEAAAKAVTRRWWEVLSSRDMTATSKMLRYRQPGLLFIVPLATDESCDALTMLLTAVAQYHTGVLRLELNKSYLNYSACDSSLACLESARCQLTVFVGCLSGGSNSAWRALVGGVKRGQGAGGRPDLFISLLDPRLHELAGLDGTRHHLTIRARPPSSPGRRCRPRRRPRPRPLPTSIYPPVLRVECRPAEGGEAPGDEETAALIEDLAPKDMRYRFLSLRHYPGLNGALDGLVARLRASGVTTWDSSTRGWVEAGRSDDGWCWACEDSSSSHRPGERCVQLKL